jgi:hypothetical protein
MTERTRAFWTAVQTSITTYGRNTRRALRRADTRPGSDCVLLPTQIVRIAPPLGRHLLCAQIPKLVCSLTLRQFCHGPYSAWPISSDVSCRFPLLTKFKGPLL